MGLFNCAESRKPKKPPKFKVHCPPASEWTYGTWVGNKEEHERGRKRLSDRARQGTKPEASGKRFQKQDPRGYVDHLRAEVHQQPKRAGNVRNSDAQWATLAEIEANERYGPRGRNERYERRDSESVDERYETAYAKLIAQSARKGRSHRQQDNGVRGGREDKDPWKAGAGIAVPKVSKFRENI